MKHLLVFAAVTLMSLASFAQNTKSNISGMNINQHRQLQFTSKQEVNIKYYLLYGRQENNEEFEIIGRIPAKGNSVRTQQYRHTLHSLPQAEYYIAQVGMTGAETISEKFTEKQPRIFPEMYTPSEQTLTKAD